MRHRLVSSRNDSRPRFLLFAGGTREDREAAVREHLAGASHVEDSSAAGWPFQREILPAAPSPVVWLRDLHLAFPSGQTGGTRLILTQSTYQLQRWLDWLDANPQAHVVADASLNALAHSSPEAQLRRGPWFRIEIHEVHTQAAGDEITPPGELHAAFRRADPERRVEVCRNEAEAHPDNPALLLAYASACMEQQLLDDADHALERARALAADWEAVHFELGKLRLRTEATQGAAEAFATAARLMPTFAAAWSNLGAALGELDRPQDALDALQQALRHDPRGHPVLNNIGAVHRDAGRLDEAEAAFREVIALAPAFVFGYYNLAHTLFLKGDFAAAREAYEEGLARDPQKNARQACRLAVARAAAGDADGAIALIEELRGGLPEDRRRDLFEEAESTLDALSALPGVNAAAIARVRAVVRPYSS